MNFVISRCDAVRINGVQVSAPGDSPNTDGIHITESTNVLLQNSKIGTGSCLAKKFVWPTKISFLRTQETVYKKNVR